MKNTNEPSSYIQESTRKFFNQKNRLPRKDVVRILIKRIGHECPFPAVKMSEPFAVEDSEGHLTFYRRGSYLAKSPANDEGRLFGVTEETFKRRYIYY